eukprot:351025-Chlamydomonas_euryale.AAC.6
MHICAAECLYRCMHGCMAACIHDCTAAWLHGCVTACTDDCMAASLRSCMHRWLHGCMHSDTHAGLLRWACMRAAHGCPMHTQMHALATGQIDGRMVDAWNPWMEACADLGMEMPIQSV